MSAAATGFEGVVGVFNQDNVSPCYACLFSEEDTFEARQTCSEVGVFAPLLGVVGSYQSGLGLRLLAGGVCEGIVAWDLQQMKIRHSSLKKDPTCTVCSVYRANGA